MVYPEKPAPPQAAQQQKAGPAAKSQDQARAEQDLSEHVGHGGQQPGQQPGQASAQPAADDVKGRQEAASAGAPDGPYDEVAATDQAHAHAAPGTIEHEQLKAMAEDDPATSSDPRERNQLTEGQAMKEKARALLSEHEQAAEDRAAQDKAGQGEAAQDQDRK